MQTEINNFVRVLENQLHWLFALSLINLLFTLAVALKVRKLGKSRSTD
jgi:hypothetical protein